MASHQLLIAITIIMAFASSAFADTANKADKPLPDWLKTKVESLPPEKLQFLITLEAGKFAPTTEQLYERFKQRSAKEIEAYIDGMMQVLSESEYHPERDPSNIPLNTNSERFNGWKVRRPKAFDLKREPGPINVQRYIGGSEQLGIPTFFKLPVALRPEDLKAGKIDVAIMGIPLDMGSGMRGAAYGPRAVRIGNIYGGWGMVRNPHMHAMISPFNVLNIVDYGDVAVDMMSTERSMAHIRKIVAEVAATGTIPMIVGGDHSLMYPDVAGITDVYGKGKVGVIHFDAHYDAGRGSAHLISHGQPVARLIEEGHVPGKNFIQVGLRGYWPGKEGFEFMRKHDFHYHTMVEIEDKGWDKVMKHVMKEALDGPEYIYISFDIDVLDPAYMPGTGTPEPGGLTTREVFPLLRRLCAEKNVVGFELVELNPLADPGYTTALNSERILRECLTGIAMRKKGLTDPHYLSPLTVDDKQD